MNNQKLWGITVRLYNVLLPYGANESCIDEVYSEVSAETAEHAGRMALISYIVDNMILLGAYKETNRLKPLGYNGLVLHSVHEIVDESLFAGGGKALG